MNSLRFVVAGVIPFFCIFTATILQYKIIFALGGMVNHTLADGEIKSDNGSYASTEDGKTCVLKTKVANQKLYDDGPFKWNPGVEGMVVSAGLFGCMAGMVVALFIYDTLDSRLIVSVTFGISGALTIATPLVSEAAKGNPESWLIVSATEFLVCAFSSILTPEIPTLINNWFLAKEFYLVTNVVLMGLDSGRIMFTLTGAIVGSMGWQWMFHLPGILSILVGVTFYIFVTREPVDNIFLSEEEKVLLATEKGKPYTSEVELNKEKEKNPSCATQTSECFKKVLKFKRDMKFFNRQTTTYSRPWGKIVRTPMVWLSIMQQTSQTWIMSMTIYMNKDFLEEIHGYSVEEAAMMVSLPTNLMNILVYITSGHLADFLVSKNVAKIRIRQMGVIIQILSVVPTFAMPFLPCKIMSYRAFTVFVHVWSSLRIIGTLAGYASFNDISPTFQGTLVTMSYFSQNSLPGLLISFLKGVFGFTPVSAWQKNYAINCSGIITLALLYLIFLDTTTADWEPNRTRKVRASNLSMEISSHSKTSYLY